MQSADIDTALALTPSEIGPAILRLAEGQWFDRKSARIAPRKLAEALVGFANADGGIVVVGVHDGFVEGITDLTAGQVNALRQTSIDFCEPPVPCMLRDLEVDLNDTKRSTLLAFDIPASEHLHQTVDHKFYLRVGDETRRLDDVTVRELTYDKSHQSFESSPLRELTHDDLDHDLLDNYARRLGHEAPLRLLSDRTLSKGRTLTVAAGILFAECPTRFLPSAQIRVIRYQGRSRLSGREQRIISDHRIESPIPRGILEARDLIQRLQPTRTALGPNGVFEDIPTVPPDAWLEGLVNAVVHRSYSLQGDYVRIEIFDDRIEISNPGPFPQTVDLTDVRSIRRFARNPRIVRVCSDLKICQELGEGIRRIFYEMKQHGLSAPLYRQTTTTVTLTLSAEPMNRRLDDEYRVEVQAILAALRDNERLSTSEAGAAVGNRSRPLVRQLLKDMREAEMIEWTGKSATDPRAFWHLPNR